MMDPLAAITAAFSCFLLVFVAQILVQRFYRPVSEDKFIVGFYTGLPLVIFLLGLWFRFFDLVDPEQAILTYLLFFVLSSSWVASYPAVYAVCPTLIMSYVISRNQNGTSTQEIVDLLALKENSEARIDDAVHDKWITKSGSQVELTRVGIAALWFFQTYRRILGLKLETL